MVKNRAIVITTIQNPTASVRRLAQIRPDWSLIVVGDKKTPSGWNLSGVEFLPFEDQVKLDTLACALPPNHYARKNLGYLLAMRRGAEVIYETDDDNLPYDNLLASVEQEVHGFLCQVPGWINVYRQFTDFRIWPRGFPLELINASFSSSELKGINASIYCPVQQYLADGDPDVDAIFRLTNHPQPIRFREGTVILGTGSYCPFNSQNTLWWPDAFPLLYLPSHVSFRMTDIWRSYIAQICLYRGGYHIAFREATVFQDRNAHDLLRDFRDEVPGYLSNPRILQHLESLPLSPLPEKMGVNLQKCYEALVEQEIVPEAELELVRLWLNAIDTIAAKTAVLA